MTIDTKLPVSMDNHEHLDLPAFQQKILGFLDSHGLPTASILADVSQRAVVFQNLRMAISLTPASELQTAHYISKFVAAVANGLFDAALNYLWDQTVLEIRRRVVSFDISYFYDNAVSSADKRKDLKTEDDLVKLADHELIHGALEVGLISDLGFKHLDYIRYMRNWASAAHPNNSEITGLQLASWLETCIREVISLPLSSVAIEIKKLLVNLKKNILSSSDAKTLAAFFSNMTPDQVNTLASGFFGIYTRQQTTPSTRANIHLLLPYLWPSVGEKTREGFGVKQGRFLANNDQAEAAFARNFLEVVDATSYQPEGLRAIEIDDGITNLLNAHRGTNNFYSEPPFARELQRLIGPAGKVPKQVLSKYVLALVEVFLTNGNGVAWNAEPTYLALFDQFDDKSALRAILSYQDKTIASQLQFALSQTKYRELVKILKSKIADAASKELIVMIEMFNGPLDKIGSDTPIKRRTENLLQILTRH